MSRNCPPAEQIENKFGEEVETKVAFLRTTSCRRHGHPEFRVTYDGAIVPVDGDVKWFIDWLEESVARGVRYSPGQTCQVGWVTTEVQQRSDGDLAIWEPDMQQMPVVWVEGVSHTLAYLRLQKDVVESVLSPTETSIPSMRESAIICTRLGKENEILMERTTAEGADSGWFCGCRAEDHDHNDVSELLRVSLFEAVMRYARALLPYLALPVGTLVALGTESPVIFQDGERLSFKPGSYLERRFAAP
jgi:hypothetical protein